MKLGTVVVLGKTQEEIRAKHTRNDVALFTEQVLGIKLTQWQRQLLKTLSKRKGPSV
jgi:hypothetical protein